MMALTQSIPLILLEVFYTGSALATGGTIVFEPTLLVLFTHLPHQVHSHQAKHLLLTT
jgi:hypothetical protein